MSKKDLAALIKKNGIKSSIESEFGGTSPRTKAGNPRKVRNMERSCGEESLLPERLSLQSSGICEVVFTVYRRYLADYSRANSEKAYIDCLVELGFIPDDSEKEIRLIDGGQHKVKTNAEERVEIELRFPSVDLDKLWGPWNGVRR